MVKWRHMALFSRVVMGQKVGMDRAFQNGGWLRLSVPPCPGTHLPGASAANDWLEYIGSVISVQCGTTVQGHLNSRPPHSISWSCLWGLHHSLASPSAKPPSFSSPPRALPNKHSTPSQLLAEPLPHLCAWRGSSCSTVRVPFPSGSKTGYSPVWKGRESKIID